MSNVWTTIRVLRIGTEQNVFKNAPATDHIGIALCAFRAKSITASHLCGTAPTVFRAAPIVRADRTGTDLSALKRALMTDHTGINTRTNAFRVKNTTN